MKASTAWEMLRFRLDVGIEEALADDAECEQKHVLVQIAWNTGAPGPRHLEGVIANDGAIGGDAVTMEGGLGEPALAEVQRLFAGEQAIAEHEAGTLHDDAAMVTGLVADEHLLNQGGMVALEDVAAGRAEVDQVAVEACVLAEKCDGAVAKDLTGEGAPDERWAGWPGRAGGDAGFVSVGPYFGHEWFEA